MTKIKNRILQFIENERIGISEFSRRTGIPHSNFSGKGLKSEPGTEMVVKILTAFPQLNVRWLLTGEGIYKVSKSDETQPVDSSTKNTLNSTVLKSNDEMYSLLLQNNKGTRYFDNYASAGLISGITDGRTRPDAVILVPGLDDCNFAINVYGDSMYPKYCAGEIVMCKEMQIDSQLTYIRFGEAYVVVLDDGTVLKYIQPGADDEHLEFESENSRYKPYQVHKSRIQKMYLVKGVITRKNF